MKTCLLVLWWLSLVLASFAAVPPGYYSPIEGQQAAGLKVTLCHLLQHHSVLKYDSLWSYFTLTDTHSDGTVWDMYSDRRQQGFRGMNREHAFPKSWWGGAINAAYSDLHHLYPADEAANLAKSNYPLGIVGITVFDNGVSKVGYDCYSDSSTTYLVFEPADAYKGDFARAYFYMATCYQDVSWKHTFMVESNPYPTLKQAAIRLLMDWHQKDPVSDKERIRNEVVFDLQHNRNPFIDYPELASYLWGDSTTYTFSLTGREGEPTAHSLLQVYARQGALYVWAAKQGLRVDVFNPTGIRVLSLLTTEGQQGSCTLLPGVYVVTCLGRSWKVVMP